MCGIVGIVSNSSVSKLEVPLISMTNSMQHRGPDGFGYELFNQVAFGHRRLSIIDLSERGRQPMYYRNRYCITYNGEIYNYLELRKELITNGYVFNSDTDTEVIMAAYDFWGSKCFNKFNGMWAFALYDFHKEEIIISRDRFGIKPLYYYSDGEHFIFASEVKALLKFPRIDTEPNLTYCKNYLSHGPKEWIKETAFKNIFRFQQASYSVLAIRDLVKNGVEEKIYWDSTVNNSKESYNEHKSDEYTLQYRELLSDAVRLRLRSDVLVGSALSGGIDSSSIVYLVNEYLRNSQLEQNQNTFSSIFENIDELEPLNESPYIRQLIDCLDVNEHFTQPHADDILSDYEKVVFHMDVPFAGSLISPWNVYKLVKTTDVKVTLDGQGADEQLAGYLSYVKQLFSEQRNPWKNIKKFADIPHIDKMIRQGIYLNILKKLSPIAVIRTQLFKTLNIDQTYKHSLNERLFMNTTQYLTQHLHYGDKLSMAHSIESRVPFLDHRLVEFTMNLPACYKIHDGWTKYIARKSFENELPQNIVWRRDKLGFPSPDEYYFAGELYPYFVSCIRSAKYLLEHLGINTEINKNQIKQNTSYYIRVLNLAIWYRIFHSNEA